MHQNSPPLAVSMSMRSSLSWPNLSSSIGTTSASSVQVSLKPSSVFLKRPLKLTRSTSGAMPGTAALSSMSKTGKRSVAWADSTPLATSLAASFKVPSALSCLGLTSTGSGTLMRSGPPPRKVQPVSRPGPLLAT